MDRDQIEQQFLSKLLSSINERSDLYGKLVNNRIYGGYTIHCFSTKKQLFWLKIYVDSNTYGHHPEFRGIPRVFYVHKIYFKEQKDFVYPFISSDINDVIDYNVSVFKFV